MESSEDAAKEAAARWQDRKLAKDELRQIVMELAKTKNMTEISVITGIKRTTLYYFVYGRKGKSQAA